MIQATGRRVAGGLLAIALVIATVYIIYIGVIDGQLAQQRQREELLPVVNWQEAWEQHQDEEERQQQDRWPGAPLVANARELASFSSPAISTTLFLHVFKCAGTSLREVFMAFAKTNGWTGAVIAGCSKTQKEFQFHDPPGSVICVRHEDHRPKDENIGRWLVSGTKVLAGHFFWDFRLMAAPPYLMVTTLRNPLELFVSALQFKHRDETRTLAGATRFVTSQMRTILGLEGLGQLGFIRVFLNDTGAVGYNPRGVYTHNETWAMATESVEHLNTFLVVGVVEQYEGFIEVLKHTLDPGLENPSVWTTGANVQNNKSPVPSRDVLRNMDPYLVRLYNETRLDLQWKVYEVALQLWDSRCREVLPPSDHERYCDVPRHADILD
ncbi:unnamed protein product [Ectocarpus sp. CCAP 1310/34]|nr:unnamed protein product [Ectocarpus sp. CCAP 1310/34]